MKQQYVFHLSDEDFFALVQESVEKKFKSHEGYVVGICPMPVPGNSEPGFQITMNGIPEALERLVGGGDEG